MTRAAARPRFRRLAAVAAVVLVPALAAAKVEVVAVTPGTSASVVIDGGSPITIEVGDTVQGVGVVRADRWGAVLRIRGVERESPLVPYRGPIHEGTSASVTLSADGAGHFFTRGSVNGESVDFLVDTGATLTTLSRATADAIDLDYRDGARAQARTVNGIVDGWRVSLGSVQVGDLMLNDVEGLVVDTGSLPVALLGMSFLNRLDMQRSGSTLVLRRR